MIFEWDKLLFWIVGWWRKTLLGGSSKLTIRSKLYLRIILNFFIQILLFGIDLRWRHNSLRGVLVCESMLKTLVHKWYLRIMMLYLQPDFTMERSYVHSFHLTIGFLFTTCQNIENFVFSKRHWAYLALFKGDNSHLKFIFTVHISCR